MKKILMFLFSLLISVSLWLYVVTVVSPESTKTYYNIPVVMQGINILTERGLMLTSGAEQTVSLTFTGNRSDLNKINSNNITLIADLTKVDSDGEQVLQYTYSLPGDVPNNAVTVQSWDPKYIVVTVEDRISKDIPVEVQYSGTIPNGYIADKENSVLDYSFINAVGPASVINRIASARIDVDLTQRSESLDESFRYTLCDENGEAVDVELVTTNVAEVRLSLSIQRVMELPLTLTVVDGGGATQQTSKITIEPRTIRVSGNEQLLEKLTEYNLGTIRLAEIVKDTDLTYQISLPEGVNNLSGVTEVTVSVKFPDLAVKEFTVKQIIAENVPDGMEAEILSQAITVTVRGAKHEVAALTEKNITVYVDFGNAVEGTSTTKARIVIDSKYPNVGCLGTYSVSVTLWPEGAERDSKTNGTDS